MLQLLLPNEQYKQSISKLRCPEQKSMYGSELIAVMMIGGFACTAAVRIIVDFLVVVIPYAIFLMQSGSAAIDRSVAIERSAACGHSLSIIKFHFYYLRGFILFFHFFSFSVNKVFIHKPIPPQKNHEVPGQANPRSVSFSRNPEYESLHTVRTFGSVHTMESVVSPLCQMKQSLQHSYHRLSGMHSSCIQAPAASDWLRG